MPDGEPVASGILTRAAAPARPFCAADSLQLQHTQPGCTGKLKDVAANGYNEPSNDIGSKSFEMAKFSYAFLFSAICTASNPGPSALDGRATVRDGHGMGQSKYGTACTTNFSGLRASTGNINKERGKPGPLQLLLRSNPERRGRAAVRRRDGHDGRLGQDEAGAAVSGGSWPATELIPRDQGSSQSTPTRRTRAGAQGAFQGSGSHAGPRRLSQRISSFWAFRGGVRGSWVRAGGATVALLAPGNRVQPSWCSSKFQAAWVFAAAGLAVDGSGSSGRRREKRESVS